MHALRLETDLVPLKNKLLISSLISFYQGCSAELKLQWESKFAFASNLWICMPIVLIQQIYMHVYF